MDVYSDTAKWTKMLWVSIYMEMKWGTKTVCCQIMWGWTFLGGWGEGLGGGGVRGVQDDNILSMHLESHIGLFSAPLYDFNGKALWEHAPQEISKMKCVGWWLEVNGCFLFSLLAFSLVYFVGLVSQSSDIPLSSKSQIKKASHDLRREDIPIHKKQKKHSYSSKVQSWWGVWPFQRIWTRRKRQYESENAYTQSSLIHGFCLIFFYIVKKWNICFYLNFSSYLSASQPQIVTQCSGALRERVVVTSSICTCSSEGNEVCIFETEQSLCSKPP